MIPMLGVFSLDQWQARVSDRQCFERGRLGRVVTVRGAADDFESDALLTQALDLLVGATMTPTPTPLRLRPGRALPVRLRSFTRETLPGAVSGAFTLELEAVTPWEEADEDQETTVSVADNGQAAIITPDGTLDAPLRMVFQASGPVMMPRFEDGRHSLSYFGLVPDGAALTLDAGPRRAWLDEEEITSQVHGDYLTVTAPETPISVYADMGAPPMGTLVLSWRNRWV